MSEQFVESAGTILFRRIGEGEIKLIWWFVASVNEELPVGLHEKDKFEVEFHNYDEVLRRLTFKDDREIVKKAIDLVKNTPSI